MRAVLLLTMTLLVPGVAFADQSVAGTWTADLGSNVEIVMAVTADGHWKSETSQNGSVVARMDGTYQQIKNSAAIGHLIFTPTQSETTRQHGAPMIEHDSYHLSNGGRVMQLTSGGDTMNFRKR